jgi:uncharacterized FlaG/YvyC family protein
MIEEDENHPKQAFFAANTVKKKQPSHVQTHRRHVHFDTHGKPGHVLITVLDTKTASVVRQIDSGDLLKLALRYDLPY